MPIVISGSSCPEFSYKIYNELLKYDNSIVFKQAKTSKFSNGELNVSIEESKINVEKIEKNDVIIIQTETETDNMNVNDMLMELIFMINICNDVRAKSITVVIPNYFYARSDKHDITSKLKPYETIGAKVIAKMIENAGASQIITVDLHAPQIHGFFGKPCKHINIYKTIVRTINDHIFGEDHNSSSSSDTDEIEEKKKYILIAPDVGASKRTAEISKMTGIDNAIMQKQRDHNIKNKVAKINLIGDVDGIGKTAIILDDMCDTAGTMVEAANLLVAHGVKDVVIIVTHGIFSGPALERLNNCECISKVYTTDTIPQAKNMELCDKIDEISIHKMLAKYIHDFAM